MTESRRFTIRIASLPYRHAEFISVSGFCSLPCRHAKLVSVSRLCSLPCCHAEFISVSRLCRSSTDPETSSG
jgi:hypothetical protein